MRDPRSLGEEGSGWQPWIARRNIHSNRSFSDVTFCVSGVGVTAIAVGCPSRNRGLPAFQHYSQQNPRLNFATCCRLKKRVKKLSPLDLPMTHGLLQLIGLCSTQRPSGKLQGLRIASSPRHRVRLDWPHLTYCQSQPGGWMTNKCWLCSSLRRRVICGTKTASTSDTPHTLVINCSLLCNMANGSPRLFPDPASHDFYVIHLCPPHLAAHLLLSLIWFHPRKSHSGHKARTGEPYSPSRAERLS